MMLGERNHHHHLLHPHFSMAIQIPSLRTSNYEEKPVNVPILLQSFLPSNDDCVDQPAIDAYSCDQFRIYEFKVRRCPRGRSHDWTECPYAHQGEKARRRDPRKYHYSGTACPEFKKGSCKKGEACEFAHGVFECWLHPSRYRTQPCKDGTACRRRVCFFAHTPEQLRMMAPVSPGKMTGCEGYDGSPMRRRRSASVLLSPTSTLVSPTRFSESPPESRAMEDLVMEMRKLELFNSTAPPARATSWPMEEMGPVGYGGNSGGYDFWSHPVTERVNLDSNVDEPEWFSDLVN